MRRKKTEYEDKDRGIRGLLDEAESDPPEKKSRKEKRSSRESEDDLDLDAAWGRD